MIRSLHTDIVEHFQAVLAMHTGSATVPLPSLGAWLSFGLGTFNRVVAVVHGALRAHALRRQPGVGQQFPAADPSRRAHHSRAGTDPGPAAPAKSVTLEELERQMLRDVERATCRQTPRRR